MNPNNSKNIITDCGRTSVSWKFREILIGADRETIISISIAQFELPTLFPLSLLSFPVCRFPFPAFPIFFGLVFFFCEIESNLEN